MEVRCPRCGYSWRTRSRKLYLTCPNCHRKFRNPLYSSNDATFAASTIKPFNAGVDATTTTIPYETTTTTTSFATTEQVRELYRLPSGHRVIEVFIDGSVLRFLCSEDLSACDSEKLPDDIPEEVIVKAIELLHSKKLVVVDRSSDGSATILSD